MMVVRQKYDATQNHEDLENIIGVPPKWIIRRGISIIIIVLICVLIFSYFFKYSETVQTEIYIISENPPISLFSRNEGKIKKFMANNNAVIDSNSIIAIINSTVDYEQLEKLKFLLNNYHQKLFIDPSSLKLTSLGELQSDYLQFKISLLQFYQFEEQKILLRKISCKKDQIAKRKEILKTLKENFFYEKTVFTIIKAEYQRDSALHFQSKALVSYTEYSNIFNKYYSELSKLKTIEASIKSNELSILSLNEEVIELLGQNELNELKLKQECDETYYNLVSRIDIWEDRCVIRSPIRGKISCTKYWHENQYVSNGERVVDVIPLQEGNLLGKIIIPIGEIGKVYENMDVLVKLASFPSLKYGTIKAKINNISLLPTKEGYHADIFFTEGLKSNFKEDIRFIQGMNGSAEIVTKKERLLYRFFFPLKQILTQ